jgi:hypothetical protein
MAIWQIMKAGVPQVEPNSTPPATWFFDDGAATQPGDDGFTTDAVKSYVATLGAAGDGFNYVGSSPSAPDQTD